MNAQPQTQPETRTLYGEVYTRRGAPVYHVQITSYRGGFLSTPTITENRGEVGAIAEAAALRFASWSPEETARECWKDCLLLVTDRNLTAGGRSAPLASYRWDRTAGRFVFSHGTRIAALDALAALVSA